MPDLVKKWKEQHPYLTQLEDELNEENERKQKENQRRQEEYERQYSQYQAQQNRDIANSIKLSSPLEMENRAQQERVERMNTGPNKLTPALEAGVQANAGKNGLTPYQVFMQAQMAKVPTAPVKEEKQDTRTDRQLFNDYLKQTARANSMDRMATDYTQGVQGRSPTASEQMLGMSDQGIQQRLYDPTYTTRLSAIGERMENQRAKADKATELYNSVTTEKKLQKEREKYLPLMSNPDFLKNSQGSQAIADAGMATATGSNAKARLYRDIYYRGTAGIDGKGVTDSAARNVNDEEAAMFFYLWNTQGSDAAETYYNDYVKNRASQRQMEIIQDQARAYGEYDPIGASVRSVGTQIMSGVGLVDMAWQNFSRLVGLTSASNPLNYYSPAQSFGLKTDAYREGAMDYLVRLTADELERAGVKNPDKYAKVAGFLYQTGMSMADSGVAALMVSLGIPEPLTLANMGASAGTRAIRDARERGATDGQALAFGISSAIMEALFEKISMDKILEPSYADTVKAHIWNAVSQSFTEGSEEVMTTLANTAMDQLIMGDKSEMFTRQRELMEQGVSEKEALGAAFKQWGTQVLGDFLGGLISGFGMGGIKEAGYAAGALRNRVNNELLGVDIQNMVNANQQEQRLRQQYEQQNAPQQQQQTKLTIPSQETVSARQADPLGYAMNKATSGETVTKQDARAIIENPQAIQALRDSGVLTGKVTNDSEGRGKVVDAVNALAENQRQIAETPAATENISQETAQIPQETAQAAPMPTQENAQQEERVSTPPVPRAQERASEAPTEGKLRIPEQKNTPPVPRSGLTVRSVNDTLNENRQEGTNGQAETAASSEAERARKESADFREAANKAAGSKVLDRAEWNAGLGRLLQAVRNARDSRNYEQRRSEAARITNQAEAGNPDRLSAKDLGLANGSDEKLAVEVAAKILGPDAEETVARLAKQGVTLRFISGQMRLNKLDSNGKPVQVRAYVSEDRKNIVVQADNPRVTWQQLLAHEELHKLIKENAEYRKSVMDALLADKKVAPYLSQIIDRYADAYHGADPKATDEEIIEELLADYRAGFDMLDPLGTNRTLSKVTKAAAKDILAVEKNYTTNGGKPAPEGVTENFAEGKNSVEPPYRRGTAALTRFEESLSPEARKTYDLFNKLNIISNKGTAVITVGSGKAAHLKRDTIADKSFFAKDWNNYVKNNEEFAAVARELVAALPKSVKDFGHFNDDGTVTPTEFEEKFKMNRSFIQRVVDALPKNVVQPVMNIDGHEYRISDKPISGAVGGEEYRQAIIAEKRRLYKEGNLPTVSTGSLSHDNWGAMGFLATNTKTGASGDFTTFCPQMYFNNGCFYCYRRAALTSGSNNKLTGETVWYSGEILQLRPSDVEDLNKKGGLRIQSFGDWQDMYTPMLADMLYDAQLKGLQIKIITKEPSMIETVAKLRQQALGLSLYFNLSADYTIERRGESDNRETQKAAPLNAERPFIEQEWLTGEPGEDIGWKRALSVQEANEYRKKYPWVNTRIVATTLKEYIRGLIDPTVDVVTGYHGKIKYQERVSSETGETLIEVEALGDSGMPQFTKDEMTGEWSISRDKEGKLLNGKNRYQKALCDAIIARGLQEAYYTKACCITGHCEKCQGQCGAYANKMSTKNARNRDPDNLRWVYAQMEMHPGAGMENSQLFAENLEDTEGLTQAEDLVDIYDREHGIEPLQEKPVEQQLAEREKWLNKKQREAERKAAKAAAEKAGATPAQVEANGKYSTEIDADYLSAVNSGDMETAQRMVDEAAKKAGYTVRKYHQTDVPNIHVFDIGIGTHGGTDSETPYGIFTKNTRADIGLGDIQMSLYLKPGKTFVLKDRSELRSRMPEAYNLLATKLEEVDAKYNALVEEAEDALFDAQDAYEEKHPEAEVTLDDIVNNRTYDDPACQRANEHWKAVMAEWSKEADKIRVQAKEVLSKYLRDSGYDSMEIKLDKGTNGRSTDTFIVFSPEQVKSADPVTYDDNGKVIPLSQRFNTKNEDTRYSLEMVDPIQPVSEKWQRGATYDEVKAAHPTLFELAADEAETRNPTQINGTVKTYRKIYDMLKQEGFDGTILDASSGLGYGTRAGRDEYGYDVDDIEPFPDKSYSPKYTDYSKLKKTYDVVISNAVLNVIPQDLRDAMVVKIGEMLNPGGRAFINVRGTDVKNAKSKVAINEDQMEYFIADSGSYQKGFRQAELVDYLKDALGAGFTVTPNSSFGGVSAVVTKNGGRASIEIDPEVAAQFSPEAIARRQSNRAKGVKGERKVSRVRSNTYEYSGLFNAAEADMIEANKQNYTYDVTKETTSMNNARKRLADDFDGEVTNLGSKNDQWSGEDLDTAMGILHRYRTEGRATGDYGDFWRWSKVIQEKGTIGGKFIQAFAKYTRTGTGAAMKGAKDIHDRFKLNPAQQKQVDAAKKKLMDGIDGDMDGAAQDAMKQAKGKKEPTKKQDGKVDKKKLDAEVQRRKDAERLVREISKLFEKQQNHGEPVENWLNLTGEELARKIAGRFSEPKQRTKTTMQTILSDLVGFAEEHALPDRKKAEGTKRTAIDTITDYLNNRDAYGTAWAAAQSYLRAAYTDDQEKLDALNSFLTATIAYNAEGTDRTMLDAILQSADVLGISEKRILELTSAGATASTIDRIGNELVSQVKERMGADYDESFTQQLKDAVRRHITGIALQESAEEQRLRLGGMTTDAARQLELNLQKLLTQSRGDKNKAAQSVADYLIRELGIPSSDAAIAAERITGAFMDELASRADRKLQQMFAEKKPKTQEQRDKLLDLIRLGGLTNSNVEDAVVDALGIGGMSRERQRELVGIMAQFGETLDAMETDDLDGLKDLIRAQAAVRNTPLSRQAEKTLAGETDAEYLREFALAQLDAIAGDFAEMSLGAKISTFQTISHLLNMRTALRNLTSNQVFDLVDSAANNLATIPDMVIGAFTGKRTVGTNKSWLSEMKRAGAKQGAARNALEVRLDVSPDDRQKSKYGTAGRRTNSMAASNAFGRILSHLEEVMGYELNTTDEFHKGSVRGETLESLARFVERGDITQEQANAWAEEEALYRSFQDDTLVGNIMGELKTLLNVIGFGDSGKTNSRGRTIHDFGLGDLVVKYTQVPGALIHRGIEYSPLGYAKMIYDLAIAKDSLVRTQRRGEDVTNAQRKLALDIGRATTGSGLITLFAVLAKAGLLRRDDDDKDKNAKAMHAAQGLSGTQLNLTALKRWIEGGDLSLTDGDVLADIGFLEPLDSLMTIATLMANDDDLKLTDIGVKSLDGVWKAISNTSAMQTISNIISTVQYHDEENDLPLYFQIPIEIASDSISGFVPSPVRQLAQATDTTYRDQYRSKDLNKQIQARVMNSIPGLRQTLAPKITPLGEDRKYQKPLLNYLNATLNPGNINVYQGSGVVDELNRVYGETDDAKIWPERNAPYSFTANDEKWTLTPDERTQYQRTRGQTTANAMDAVMGTDWYKSMGATDQAEVLNWIGNFSNFVAKKEMLEARGQEYGSTTYNKYYEAWQSGTPIEEVVADKYGELVKAAEETAAAETIIAEAKIPEASKEEAETMSADAKRLYAAFLQGGVSDSTARDLATSMEGSEASGHEQWRMVYDAAGKEGEKAVTSVMTDDMKRNWNLAKDAGVSMDDYIKVREGFKDLNGNGNKSQDEWNATLDSFTFSTNAAKDKSIKGTLWQILTGSGSTKNNPYDKEAGQKVIDAKSGGGSGSGSYAPVRIPTLRIPEAPNAEKPSSGLRIRAAAPATQAPRSGLRIRAK